jgi:hypothetical protein
MLIKVAKLSLGGNGFYRWGKKSTLVLKTNLWRAFCSCDVMQMPTHSSRESPDPVK